MGNGLNYWFWIRQEILGLSGGGMRLGNKLGLEYFVNENCVDVVAGDVFKNFTLEV